MVSTDIPDPLSPRLPIIHRLWKVPYHHIAAVCMFELAALLLIGHTSPYIYIVIHRQTVSFYQNSSVWLDPQDARSRDRNPSNFTID